jgi:hypothetical protein
LELGYTLPMATNLARIEALAEAIEALPFKDQARLLERVITPQLRLHLLVDQVRRQGVVPNERRIDVVVNQAVKRVRSRFHRLVK